MIRCNARNEEMAEEEYPPHHNVFVSFARRTITIRSSTVEKKVSRSIRKGTLFLSYRICRTCIDVEENSIDAI